LQAGVGITRIGSFTLGSAVMTGMADRNFGSIVLTIWQSVGLGSLTAGLLGKLVIGCCFDVLDAAF
jgi:hypothetical protein